MASLIPETLNGTLQPAPEALERMLLMLRQAKLEQLSLGELLIDMARMDQLLDRINTYRSLFEEIHAFRSTIISLVETIFGGSAFKLRQLLHDSGSLGSSGVILHADDDNQLMKFVSKPPEPESAPKPAEEFMDDCELVEDEDMEDEDHGDNDGPKRYTPVRQWFLDVRTSRKIAYIQTKGSSGDVICNTFDYRAHQIVKAANGTLFTSLYGRRNDPIGSRKGGQDYVRITKEMVVTFLRALEVNQALLEASDVRNALGL